MITLAQWFIEKRVIYAYASGTITPYELHRHNERMIELLKSGEEPVHALLHSAPNFQVLRPDLRSGLNSLSFIRQPALGMVVQVLETKNMVSFISVLMARLMRVNYHTTKTLDEALDKLKQYDPTLDWSSARTEIIVSAETNA